MICPSCGAGNDEGAEVCFTCRAVLSPLTQGSVIGGRYEILSPLGRGGMGAVYRARDRVLDETVALKVLRGEAASAPELARRFRSEIKLARRVAHGNVCRIYEYGEDGPLQYISMELVEGTNLKEVLKRRGRLPAEQAYDVAIQVAEGLEAIHRVGIVHRDLKTLNVMVDPHGAAKVMDFGIAKRIAGEGTTSPSGSYVVGSPEYMSPEQARGQPVDSRSDIYALGIVVFEVFTGRVPFRGDTPVATLLMHLETPPPLDGPEAAAIPVPLRPVLRKALAKVPSARYASGSEMAQSLRAARDASLGPAAGGRLAPGPRAARSRLWLAVGVAVVAATVVLALRNQAGHPEAPDEASARQTPLPPPAAASAAPAASTTPVTSSAPPRTLSSPPPRVTSTAPVPGVAPPTESSVTPRPTALPPSAAPTPSSTPEPASPAPVAASEPAGARPSPEADGWLLVVVTPWAEVSVDERPIGPTPMRRLALRPGPHEVMLTHPDFRPFPRKVTIRSGETLRLVVHLETEGVRRRP